jgi:hypothetical protein
MEIIREKDDEFGLLRPLGVSACAIVSAATRLLPLFRLLPVSRFLIAGCGLFQFSFTSRNAQYQYANDYGVYELSEISHVSQVLLL